MPRRKVDHHSASVIVESDDNSNLMILSRYTPEYPKWPGYANMLGGNYDSRHDFTPWDILKRELIEEITIPITRDAEYADREDLNSIRNLILANAEPWADFLIIDPAKRDDFDLTKPGRLREAVTSIYTSEIPRQAVDHIIKVLRAGKKFVSEGELTVTTIDDLVSGNQLLAWTAPCIVGHYLAEDLPNPHDAEVVLLGQPRFSLMDYVKDFDYIDSIEPESFSRGFY